MFIDEERSGMSVEMGQLDHPDWEPLRRLVGEVLAEGFMWMHDLRLQDGRAVQAYKHCFTRRYLYVDGMGNTWRYRPDWMDDDERLAVEPPFVTIVEALHEWMCGWLAGAEDDDRRAYAEVLERVRRAERPVRG